MTNQNNDIKKNRFKEMDETATAVKSELPKLEALLKPLLLFDDPQSTKYYFEYLEKKIKNKPLRAYFSQKVYEYVRMYDYECFKLNQILKQDDLFFRKLPFVFEVVITIHYLQNHILDEKYDTKHQNFRKINQNLISSNVLRELLFEYVDMEVRPHFLNHDHYQVIRQNIRRLFLLVDIGQHVDKVYNHYNAWKSGLPLQTNSLMDDLARASIDKVIKEAQRDIPEKKEFVEAYFQRIYLTNVYFFRCITETILALCGYEGSENERLLQFSLQYGFMLQIINDYADFAYTDNEKESELLETSGKKSTDVFADLYNFNITLPLIYHLQEGARRRIEAYLEGGARKKSLISKYPRQIKQEIEMSGAIDKAILISIGLSRSARKFLDEKNNHTPYFINMCDMAVDNKFSKLFR